MKSACTTSVLIVEDDPEFLRYLGDCVHADPGLSLCAAVGTAQAAMAALERACPDVMLVDLGLPDLPGIALIQHAVQRHPACQVLVVSMLADSESVLDSLLAGAAGYVLKDQPVERIGAAIRAVCSGGSPISPAIARCVLQRLRRTSLPAQASADAGAACPLTARELEILRLLAKGLSYETVSEVLGLSSHTVVTHLKKMFRKLSVHSRAEAVFEASQLGLL